MNYKKHSQTKLQEEPEAGATYVRLHLAVGWASLLVFLTLGIVLESMHAFRVQWYLAADEAEWRRLMWTLAHAHGVLIALVHIAFAASVNLLPAWQGKTRLFASRSLISAGILMPCGFFLGGLFVYENDPGIGVWLVPAGSLLLFLAVLLTTRATLLYRPQTR